MNKVHPRRVPGGRDGFRPGRGTRPVFRHDHPGDLRARCTRTTTSRGRRRSCRSPPKSLPQITDNGKTYTVKLKKGIYFADDPAFGGKKRELTAEDVIYSLKRMADPKMRSPWAFLVEGKFVGLDEEIAAAKKSGKFDYDKKMPGMEAVDRYTVRFRLTDTDYNLPYVLAHEPTAIVAREVVEKYGESDGRAMTNPVGTGPVQARRSGCAARRSCSKPTRTTAASRGTSRRRSPATRSSSRR